MDSLTDFRLLLGVVYWLFLAILLPRWGGYQLEEAADVLDDGTTVIKLVHVPRDDK